MKYFHYKEKLNSIISSHLGMSWKLYQDQTVALISDIATQRENVALFWEWR